MRTNWLLIVAVTLLAFGVFGAVLHPCASGAALDIPETCHVKSYRWARRGYSCAWTAMEVCLRTGGEPELADWQHSHHGGAATSSNIAAALDEMGLDYYRARGKDWSIFDVADALGLPVYVSAHMGRRHAVVYAGRFQRQDGTWMVSVIDGRQKTYKWDRWARAWGGNGAMPVLIPPPSEPPRVRMVGRSHYGANRFRPLVLQPSLPAPNEPATAEAVRLVDHPMIQAMHREAIARRGGREFALDEECCKIAQRWANHMARTGSFRHGGGEQIIAKGYRTVEACFNGWMRSRGHRAWVLTDRKRAGWGYQESDSGRKLWVGVFKP